MHEPCIAMFNNNINMAEVGKYASTDTSSPRSTMKLTIPSRAFLYIASPFRGDPRSREFRLVDVYIKKS